jgi:hypothetical protein
MGDRKRKRRLLESLKEPLERSEIQTARRWLRLEAYKPEVFKGEVHLLITSDGHENKARMHWKKMVDGELHIENLGVPSDDSSNALADKIDTCLRDSLEG